MRLIDADKFKQQMAAAGQKGQVVVQLIDSQPTAYDIERVIRTLETESLTDLDGNIGPKGSSYLLTKAATTIVKRELLNKEE